jgi:hypothetical protein
MSRMMEGTTFRSVLLLSIGAVVGAGFLFSSTVAGVAEDCSNCKIQIAQAVYVAVAHCTITGATGRGTAYSASLARTRAVAACIVNGGVPQCCSHNVIVY